MVEFALVLPIFLTMILAFVDFGLGVYVYNTLQQATKDAVRRGMVISNDCGAYLKDGNHVGTYSGVQPSQGYLTYTTAESDDAACLDYSSSFGARPTVVGAVANTAGIMDRPNVTVVIAGSAASGPPYKALPAAGASIIVTTSYQHRPIFGNFFNFDVTMSATGTGIVQ